MDEITWYVAGDGPEPLGPYSSSELRQALDSGQLTLNTQVCRVGETQWGSLASEPELHPNPAAIVRVEHKPAMLQPAPAPSNIAPSSAPAQAAQLVEVRPARPRFSEVVLGLLGRHLDRLEPPPSRREILDILEPGLVQHLLHAGVAEARMAYADVLSRVTQDRVDALLEQAQKQAQYGAQLWQAVDQAERSGNIDALVAGYNSEEANVGSTIGNVLLPNGLGALIGAAIGGMFAGQRVEDAIQRGCQQYASWFDQWLGNFARQLEQYVEPSIEADLRGLQGPPAPPRFRWPKWVPIVVVLALLVVASAGGSALARYLEQHPQEQVRSAAPNVAAEEPAMPRARSLAGSWKSS